MVGNPILMGSNLIWTVLSFSSSSIMTSSLLLSSPNKYITVICLCEDDDIIYPETWELAALVTNIGVGRGVIKTQRCTYYHNDVYSYFKKFPTHFKKHILLAADEFDYILENLFPQKNVNSLLAMSFENKVLMTLMFVVQYKGNKALGLIFNCSEFYVSKVLDEMLIILAEYFLKYIPNELTSQTHSKLHSSIRAVIDNTIHKTRKPIKGQRMHYNGHYCMHGRLTQLLVDYDGKIIAFKTMIPGKVHDNLSALYNKKFVEILGNYLCIGDTAFNQIQYTVAGYQKCRLNSPEKIIFDRISRQEQVVIENVNKFLKDCKSIDKDTSFKHGDEKLFLCICIGMGFYNMKLSWGYFQPSINYSL